MKKIILAFGFLSILLGASLSPNIAKADSNCQNYSALVVIDQSMAEQFMQMLLAVNSIPLEGRLLSFQGSDALIRVFTDTDYAKRNGVSSMDVAKKVEGFMRDCATDWKIRSVTAQVCMEGSSTLDLSNIGTIGH